MGECFSEKQAGERNSAKDVGSPVFIKTWGLF